MPDDQLHRTDQVIDDGCAAMTQSPLFNEVRATISFDFRLLDVTTDDVIPSSRKAASSASPGTVRPLITL